MFLILPISIVSFMPTTTGPGAPGTQSARGSCFSPAHSSTPTPLQVGEAPSTIEHYYAPLIRVPIFQPPLDSHASVPLVLAQAEGGGVAATVGAGPPAGHTVLSQCR